MPGGLDGSYLSAILDPAADQLVASPPSASTVIAQLAVKLREWKLNYGPEAWQQAMTYARAHRLRWLLHEDPLTARAFSKPRGYQGDAQLLDVIYRKEFREVHPNDPTPLGKAIWNYTIECKAPSAVRTRRGILAKLIDRAASEVNHPNVLSVACGHLREAQCCTAVESGNIGRFLGLDQDPDSLALIQRELGPFGVETVQGSIKLLLGGPLARERFDLIYAAGLFDYLDTRLARRLTQRMFDMLSPKGRLLIANYLPEIEDVGYMEVYMGWSLIYRDLAEIEKLAIDVDSAEILDRSSYTDEAKQVGYLVLQKI